MLRRTLKTVLDFIRTVPPEGRKACNKGTFMDAQYFCADSAKILSIRKSPRVERGSKATNVAYRI